MLAEWMWQPNSDALDTSHGDEWIPYTDIENNIIEEAFQAKHSQFTLNNYYINFNDSVQISKTDNTKQNHVKRIVVKRESAPSRKEHFTFDPNSNEQSFGGQYGWIPPFIKEARKYLNLKKNQLPSRDPSIVPTIVDAAISGIIEEGRALRKSSVAMWMAEKLRNEKNKSLTDVWKCCAYLYSCEDFLYKIVNKTMRLVGNTTHEEVWRSKIRTLGPFCLLLWDNPFNKRATTEKDNKILYRIAKLTEGQINSYRELSQHPNKYGSFQAFTSCSRSLSWIDKSTDHNVLFVMKITFAFTADIAKFSQYPEEQEELVFPGVCFTVDGVEVDEARKKTLINLNLKQRFNKSATHEISNIPMSSSVEGDFDREKFYAARRSSIAFAAIDTGYLDASVYVRDYGIDEK